MHILNFHAAFKFDEEELAKAGKDLEESESQEKARPTMTKADSVRHITPTTTEEDLTEENYQRKGLHHPIHHITLSSHLIHV